MPVITDIKQQTRNKQYYSVSVDGEYAFSISDLQLSINNLRIGQELATSRIDELRHQAEYSKALSRAHYYLRFRPRSRKEMTDYLLKQDHHPKIVDSVILELQNQNLINDQQFIESWVASRAANRPRSSRVLRQELLKKGISAEDLDASFQELEVSATSDEMVLRQLIEKRRLLTKYPDKTKLIGYLMRQGFDYGTIKKALSE